MYLKTNICSPLSYKEKDKIDEYIEVVDFEVVTYKEDVSFKTHGPYSFFTMQLHDYKDFNFLHSP